MSWEEAAKEAIASADQSEIILTTIELRHPLLPEPVRLVCAYENYDFRLEADAPLQPGEVVTFLGCPFQFEWPTVQENKEPTMAFTIDNVSQIISGYLEIAIGGLDPIQITIRPYLESAPLDGPCMDPVIHMQIREVDLDDTRVQAVAGVEEIHNAPFPRSKYTPKRFPGLVR